MEFSFDCPSEYYELDILSIRSKLDIVYTDLWFAAAHEPPSDPDLSFFVETTNKDKSEKENVVNNESYVPPNKRKRISSDRVESGKISKDPQRRANPSIPSKKVAQLEWNTTSMDSNKSFDGKPIFVSKALRTGDVVPIAEKPQRKLTKVAISAKCSRPDESNSAKELEKSLEAMLREHNSRFAPTPTYIPPKHSVRDVRKWEKLSGKAWSDLKPEERERVNEEIEHLKASNSI